MTSKKYSSLSKINILVIALSILICLSYAIIYLIKRDFLMGISSIIVIILPFIMYIFESKIKHNIPDGIKLLYLIFIFLSAVLGAIGDFYTIVSYYDKVVHFLSGVLISIAFFIFIKYFNINTQYKKGIIILSTIIFNAATAAFWEICEFCFDLVFHKGVQRGLTDTMMDMITAVIGSIIITIILINQLANNKGLFKDKNLLRR